MKILISFWNFCIFTGYGNIAPVTTAVVAAGGALPYELLRPNVFKPELKEELKLELLVFGPLFAKATQM